MRNKDECHSVVFGALGLIPQNSEGHLKESYFYSSMYFITVLLFTTSFDVSSFVCFISTGALPDDTNTTGLSQKK